MSTFSLQTVVSAPLELDSDCMEPRAAGPHEPGFQARSLGHAGSGGLGMALEEELAMLTGDRDDQEELPDQETPSPGQNADLSLFRQKEKDLVLAAKLGKALLERNQDLTKQYEKMHKDLNEKLERRGGRVGGPRGELEADVQQLQGELDQNQLQLREAERDKSTAIRELSNQNHRLLEQLSRAAEVERQLSTQVNSLRDDFRSRACPAASTQPDWRIKMLAERKMELERRLHAMLEENELLQSSVDELRERTMLLERHSHHKDLQLRQSHAELQEAQLSHRQLSVRSLCSHLRGNDLTDSALSTDSSMDESSETSSAKEGSRRSDEEAVEEVRRLGEELREVRDLYEEEQHKTNSNQEEPSEQLQTAIRDRDDAIANQLLDAIQQKLNLSQQLEAWQDDMHRVIDQQLMDKYQDEWRPPPSVSGPPPGASSSRRAHRFSDPEGEDIKDDEERQEVTSQGLHVCFGSTLTEKGLPPFSSLNSSLHFDSCATYADVFSSSQLVVGNPKNDFFIIKS
ncbi:hypothetical protein F7725_012431 [Dissostichus mawsoni]|uniref:Bicaudal D-related protein 1 n=1 Tax=Dissostichus mawsoni TaxID=36200 RepID=A0A7J5YPI6_DISMA|nr:hypothetical protein F7725_012431 [Dissostichus mawsoni]